MDTGTVSTKAACALNAHPPHSPAMAGLTRSREPRGWDREKREARAGRASVEKLSRARINNGRDRRRRRGHRHRRGIRDGDRRHRRSVLLAGAQC